MAPGARSRAAITALITSPETNGRAASWIKNGVVASGCQALRARAAPTLAAWRRLIDGCELALVPKPGHGRVIESPVIAMNDDRHGVNFGSAQETRRPCAATR